MKPGSFAVKNSPCNNLLSCAIKIFGRSKYTHTLVYLGNLSSDLFKATESLIFEADLLVKMSWITAADDSTWFIWKDDKIAAAIAEATWEIAHQKDGELYGWTSLGWFIWLWLVEGLHLPKRLAVHNLFLSGDICTGIVYMILVRGCEILATTNPGDADIILKIIKQNGRDYRSQRPIDLFNIGIRLIQTNYCMRSV